MKSLAAVVFAGVLVLGLAGCGRKTPLTLPPPPPPAQPAASAATRTVVPAQSGSVSASTGSAAHP